MLKVERFHIRINNGLLIFDKYVSFGKINFETNITLTNLMSFKFFKIINILYKSAYYN